MVCQTQDKRFLFLNFSVLKFSRPSFLHARIGLSLKTGLITALWELLVHVVEDVLLHGCADGRLLDTYEEVAPSLESDQPRTRNGGSSELSIVVELQCIVCGMEY